MFFKTLRLVNFRNFKESVFNLSPHTIICGKNGAGKSNIVEALFLLSCGKSFRGAKNQSLVLHNKKEGAIQAELDNQKKQIIRLVLKAENNQNTTKELYLDSKKKNILDFLGKAPTVVFAPEHLSMVWDAPRARRSFLDLLIAQSNRMYAKELFRLSQVLKNRNKLLFRIKETGANTKELKFWNHELVELGSKITTRRIKVVKSFNKKVKSFYQKIGQNNDILEFIYESSIVSTKGNMMNQKNLTELFWKKLKEKENIEISLCQSLVSPHRDDPTLLLNNRFLSEVGSRGEARSAMIALKFAEFEYLEEHSGKAPVFLFDDVFSELDDKREKFLVKNLPQRSQLIFTAITPPKQLLKRDFKIIKLDSRQ